MKFPPHIWNQLKNKPADNLINIAPNGVDKGNFSVSIRKEKRKPKRAERVQISPVSDFLSSPVCINLCHSVPCIDTIWIPKIYF